jgi:hypothetical protein
MPGKLTETWQAVWSVTELSRWIETVPISKDRLLCSLRFS